MMVVPDLILLVDKPLEWTSFDVVKKLRYGLKIKKIGHAGTLDPLATGLLVVCTGKCTKQIEGIQSQEKEYTGALVLGQTTPSYDLETEVSQPPKPLDHLTPALLEACRESFIGEIMQVPPLHSAIKVDGKRAYELARKGIEHELKARKTTIKSFDWEVRLPEIKFKVVCSKGTYIRSLAHDVGAKLGVGGYLSELRRTRIGTFAVQDAQAIEAIIAQHRQA